MEGVVRLIRWFEKMETIFHINNFPEKYQVKYATCTLPSSALTWWNSHKRTIGADAAFSMSQRELMKLMVKNNDLAAYTQRFQELTMLCTKMVPEEEDRVEKFIGGLPDNIQGNVIAAEPTRFQDVVRIANNLMDQKLKGPCTVRYGKCNKVGHLTWDNKAINSTTSTQKSQVVNQRVVTCYECGRQGHYRNDYPKLKDQNHGNNTGNKNRIGEARGKAYVLDVSYAIELADERISKTNTVLRGCTLGLLGHPFNIDLMSMELGCFDVIMGMDWLANHRAVIVCDEKIVRNPYGDEVLVVQGDESGKGKKSKLSIISCTKTQKYIKKGCPIFLAQVMRKETEDKSEEKRLEDVPTVQDFLEVFLEDLSGLPPTRKVEF
ncbi:reverse transcriptase domain-containing protein [Tanacetum coccineum]